MEQYLTAQHLLLILERITFSIIAGAAIGLEREIARKQAGLRTMILICLGSTLYMTVSRLAALTAEQPFDVTRVAAQVVTGVGFIGAGAIIQARGHVHGLTTAATIWTVAAIGLIIGAGYPFLGLGVTAIVLFILVLIRKAEDFIVRRWVRVNDTVEDAESNEPLIR